MMFAAFLLYCFVAGGLLVAVGILRRSRPDLVLGVAVWLAPFLLALVSR